DLLVEDLGGSGPGCVARLLQLPPSVALIDLPSAGMRNLLEEASGMHLSSIFVGLLEEEDEAGGALLLQLGARGVLFPNASLAEVVQAIREVLAGGAFCPLGVVAALLERQRRRSEGRNSAGPPQISPREAEVMELASLGLTTKE